MSASTSVSLHTLASLGIADHIVLSKKQYNQNIVAGALFGDKSGSKPAISEVMSTSIVTTNTGGVQKIALDINSLSEEMSIFQEAYPLAVLGFYVCVERCSPLEVLSQYGEFITTVYEEFKKYTNDPLVLIMRSELKSSETVIYQCTNTGVPDPNEVVVGVNRFVPLLVSNEQDDAEKIAVDHACEVLSYAHVSLHEKHNIQLSTSLQQLRSKVHMMLGYLNEVRAGRTPYNAALLRNIQHICQLLPVSMLTGTELGNEVQESIDTSLLLSLFNNLNTANLILASPTVDVNITGQTGVLSGGLLGGLFSSGMLDTQSLSRQSSAGPMGNSF